MGGVKLKCYYKYCLTRRPSYVNPYPYPYIWTPPITCDQSRWIDFIKKLPPDYKQLENLNKVRLCHLHFEEQHIIKANSFRCADNKVYDVPLNKWRLTPDAFPTIFDPSDQSIEPPDPPTNQDHVNKDDNHTNNNINNSQNSNILLPSSLHVNDTPIESGNNDSTPLHDMMDINYDDIRKANLDSMASCSSSSMEFTSPAMDNNDVTVHPCLIDTPETMVEDFTDIASIDVSTSVFDEKQIDQAIESISSINQSSSPSSINNNNIIDEDDSRQDNNNEALPTSRKRKQNFTDSTTTVSPKVLKPEVSEYDTTNETSRVIPVVDLEAEQEHINCNNNNNNIVRNVKETCNKKKISPPKLPTTRRPRGRIIRNQKPPVQSNGPFLIVSPNNSHLNSTTSVRFIQPIITVVPVIPSERQNQQQVENLKVDSKYLRLKTSSRLPRKRQQEKNPSNAYVNLCSTDVICSKNRQIRLLTSSDLSKLQMPTQDWGVNTYKHLFTISETILSSDNVEIIRKSISLFSQNWLMKFSVFSYQVPRFSIGLCATSIFEIQQVMNSFALLEICEGIDHNIIIPSKSKQFEFVRSQVFKSNDGRERHINCRLLLLQQAVAQPSLSTPSMCNYCSDLTEFLQSS